MPRQAQAEETQEIDVYEIVFGHIEDAYEWHITDIGDASIRIPLPVIVKSSSGWHIFSSARLRNQARYEGLYIAPDGEYKNKIVEKDATGEEIRPFDISITKTCWHCSSTAPYWWPSCWDVRVGTSVTK